MFASASATMASHLLPLQEYAKDVLMKAQRDILGARPTEEHAAATVVVLVIVMTAVFGFCILSCVVCISTCCGKRSADEEIGLPVQKFATAKETKKDK
ncbi:unnamed protein product [Amoebophrya sp. A120]|nr:unnamed protein product [Amoebophrya sp. A120]|eukprot:GSA120T00016360001.1